LYHTVALYQLSAISLYQL